MCDMTLYLNWKGHTFPGLIKKPWQLSLTIPFFTTKIFKYGMKSEGILAWVQMYILVYIVC